MKISQFVIVLLVYVSASPSFAIDFDQKMMLTDAERHIEEVLITVDKKYVYPDTAKVMRELVNNEVSVGNYRDIRSQKELIAKLQSDLRAASKDNHISLHLAKGRVDRKTHILPTTSTPVIEFDVDLTSGETDSNKIGYLRFDKFSGDTKSKSRIANAMKELEGVGSLIIDLRENGGGDPSLVTFLSSYFLEKNTHLWSILDRNGSTTFEANSVDHDIKYQGDLCILTSKKTYSAPEAFAYTLKHLGRACIIGEATGGGAHLVQMERVNDDIDIRIPVARAYNSITKSNWEGVGVIPTIQVEALQAKSEAIEYFKSKDR
jgi:C-terminal processing protease CtpA/Prc